jgi:hypothetical protein
MLNYAPELCPCPKAAANQRHSTMAPGGIVEGVHMERLPPFYKNALTRCACVNKKHLRQFPSKHCLPFLAGMDGDSPKLWPHVYPASHCHYDLGHHPLAAVQG